MITRIKLPKLSANVEEATVTAWFKREGDTVRKGEPLVEITTDKAAIELEAPRGGVVRKILAREKSVVPAGYILALVGKPDDELPELAAANRAILARHRDSAAPSRRAARTGGRRTGGAVRATPAARRLAREQGLDLKDVRAAFNADVITEETIGEFLQRDKA